MEELEGVIGELLVEVFAVKVVQEVVERLETRLLLGEFVLVTDAEEGLEVAEDGGFAGVSESNLPEAVRERTPPATETVTTTGAHLGVSLRQCLASSEQLSGGSFTRARTAVFTCRTGSALAYSAVRALLDSRSLTSGPWLQSVPTHNRELDGRRTVASGS